MTKRIRELRREEFLAMITAGGRSRSDGVQLAAELLHVSEHTVISWLKPETSKSSNEIPLMAIELLAYKFDDPKRAGHREGQPQPYYPVFD